MNHVLTPFSRWHNLIEFGNNLKLQGVQWHLLMDGGQACPDLGNWVHRHWFPPPPKDFFVGHWMVNMFIEHVPMVDGDRYVVLTDDDYTEPGFFDKINAIEGDILICSMQRSNKPTEGSGEGAFDTLLACPENLRHGSVGFEQLIIKGNLLKLCRCEGIYHADWLLIQKLWMEKPHLFKFVPGAFVYFNRLPPGYYGRWDR